MQITKLLAHIAVIIDFFVMKYINCRQSSYM